MGAAADISPRLKKSQPASVHRVRLEKLRADGLEYANAERRAGLIGAGEVCRQLGAGGKGVSRVLMGSELSAVERGVIERELGHLSDTRPDLVAAPAVQAKPKGSV